MRGNRYLYHRTNKEAVPKILKEGLKRKGFAVYLSEKPESWTGLGTATLSVDIEGLECEITTFLPELDEVLVWGDIPPNRISIYYIQGE